MYTSAKNPDKAKGDASFKDAALSNNDDNSENVTLSKDESSFKDDASSKNVAPSKNDDNSKNVTPSKDDSVSKNDAGSKNVDASKNDVNSKSANIPDNDVVNINVKDNNSANDSADVKKSEVAVYKSAQSTKEDSVQAAKEDKAAAELPANVDKQSEVKPGADGIYDFSKDENVTNPFQNVITPKEVEELQSKTKSVRPLSSIQKIFYTPYGKNFSVENGQASGDTKSIDEFLNTYNGRLGRIDIFIFFPRVDKDGVYTADGQFYAYRSSRELKNPDESVNLDLNKAPDGKIPYKLEVNGKLVGSNLADKTNIKVYMRKNQTFIHVVMEGSNADEAILGYEGFNHEDSSGAFGYIAFIPECGAQFHFVDDLQYRKVANIKGNGELSQRSSGETDKFSTKPFTKLDLSDLSETKNIAGVRFGNNQVVRGMFTPLLRYDGEVDEGFVKRPTMDELKKTNIPGYLYYSNDIDTPKDKNGKSTEFTKDNTENFGNYDYGIVRDKDDNQVTTKHYYVTFRVVPTQLVVKYKKPDGTFELNAKYELLDSKNTQISNQFAAASEDIAASNKDALAAMMKLDKTTFIKYSTGLSAGYSSNGAVYLLPGNYTVKPTVAIDDENYEWVVESDDLAYAPKNANIDILVHKDDSISTKKVVTFVLTKKTATVTFMNEGSVYAKVKVQKTMSIDTDALTSQSMPKDPTKPGFTFNGWFTEKDGKGTKFTGDTPVSADISVYSSYTYNPPAPTPEPEPEPTPEPEPDIDWDDIPDIDLTPDKEPEPVPVPVAPAPILPPAEAEPEPAPAPSQTEQPKQPEQQPKHVAKHLPKTGSTATPILASAIASLFAGLAGLAESFAANRKRRN